MHHSALIYSSSALSQVESGGQGGIHLHTCRWTLSSASSEKYTSHNLNICFKLEEVFLVFTAPKDLQYDIEKNIKNTSIRLSSVLSQKSTACHINLFGI